ncbi:hypothetical protein Taro_029325, partial [Colocasia esculenta]|nr:hypothetical protein [Colocasia esculenta]
MLRARGSSVPTSTRRVDPLGPSRRNDHLLLAPSTTTTSPTRTGRHHLSTSTTSTKNGREFARELERERRGEEGKREGSTGKLDTSEAENGRSRYLKPNALPLTIHHSRVSLRPVHAQDDVKVTKLERVQPGWQLVSLNFNCDALQVTERMHIIAGWEIDHHVTLPLRRVTNQRLRSTGVNQNTSSSTKDRQGTYNQVRRLGLLPGECHHTTTTAPTLWRLLGLFLRWRLLVLRKLLLLL